MATAAQFRSRYAAAEIFIEADGRTSTGLPPPVYYVDRADTIVYRADVGDSWARIASRHYRGIHRRPEHLWWVLCNFQPQPVLDPTVPPQPGDLVHVPAPGFVQAEILLPIQERTEGIG